MSLTVKNDIELYVLIFASAIFFVVLGSFVIYFLILYKNRQTKHNEEQRVLRMQFRQELTQTQLEVQEQTMQTIGAELHDNIGQLLSLTSLTLNSIELDNAVKARQKIDDSIDLTLRSIKEMRLLGHLLQGDQLVAIGLSEAVSQLISWMERTGQYELIYTATDELPAASSADKDLIIFRILQEMFNNIIKHAGATRITVSLDYGSGILTLSVQDNGVGFIAAEAPLADHGMGLQNIRKRAAIIGGEAAISSDPGQGTQVIITIPYP